MNFDVAVEYTSEQQAFRAKVQSWLDENIPKDMEMPEGGLGGGEADEMSEEQFQWARQFRSKLGAIGWLAPTWPTEYGGGGLSGDMSIIISEELSKRRIPSVGDLGLSLGAPAVYVWGTEEQKDRILPKILKGEAITWQVFTEPGAGSDLAGLQTKAARDGDYYILNGTKTFVGSKWDTDYLYTLAVTDPDSPRHQNMSAFVLPADLPGISIQHLDLVAGGGKRTVFYDNVFVGKEYLLGEEGQGWRIANTTLELEHGGSGSVAPEDRKSGIVSQLIDLCKNTKVNRGVLSDNPKVQGLLVDMLIDSTVNRLFGMRNHWMRTNKIPMTYHGSQNSLWGKMNGPKLSKAILDIVGPYALLDDKQFGPLKGALENQQRNGMVTHPGGTPEIQKVIMARRIGMSRTRETAAPVTTF